MTAWRTASTPPSRCRPATGTCGTRSTGATSASTPWATGRRCAALLCRPKGLDHQGAGRLRKSASGPADTALETGTVSSDQFRPALSSNVAAAADGPCAVCAAQSFTSDLQKFTREHGKMKCYGLGLGLNTFKMVALTEHFRKLELPHLLNAYSRCVGLFPAGMCLNLRIWCMRSATMLAGASVNKLPSLHIIEPAQRASDKNQRCHLGCGPATHAGPPGSCPCCTSTLHLNDQHIVALTPAFHLQVQPAAVPAGLRRHAAAGVQHLHEAQPGGAGHSAGADGGPQERRVHHLRARPQRARRLVRIRGMSLSDALCPLSACLCSYKMIQTLSPTQLTQPNPGS